MCGYHNTLLFCISSLLGTKYVLVFNHILSVTFTEVLGQGISFLKEREGSSPKGEGTIVKELAEYIEVAATHKTILFIVQRSSK